MYNFVSLNSLVLIGNKIKYLAQVLFFVIVNYVVDFNI